MNFNQLSRLSPFMRVASRHIASTKTINKACVKLMPIRCLASDSKAGKAIHLKSLEEELKRKQEHHSKQDWGGLMTISWQIGIVMAIGCAFIAVLCVKRNNFMVMEFDTRRISLEDTKDLDIDNE